MVQSWRTQEQDTFCDENLASFIRSFEEKTLKDVFWPRIMREWFEKWPLSPPSDDLIQEKGSVEKATKFLKKKRVNVSICLHQ